MTGHLLLLKRTISEHDAVPFRAPPGIASRVRPCQSLSLPLSANSRRACYLSTIAT